LYREHGGPGGIPRAEMWRLHTTFLDQPFDIEVYTRDHEQSEVVRRVFANTCDPEHGVPLLLYRLYANEFDPLRSFPADVNAGGDNVHRGMLLGLLVGAASGLSDELFSGLRDPDAIAEEIDTCVERIISLRNGGRR
jgi:hypothetical protein